MFKIYFINFGYYSDRIASSFEEAKQLAKKFCFQCRIEDTEGNMTASYCPLNGFKYYHPQ